MEQNVSEPKRQPEKPLSPPDILLAEHFSLRQLPGFLRRYLTLGEQQYGLKLVNGQVVENLPSPQQGIARKPVGWAILGLEERSAVRLWTSPVQLRPCLFRMFSGDEPPLPVDIFLSVSVQITDPACFYSTLPVDRKEYRYSDLANEIAICLKVPLQNKLGGYAAEDLNLDEGGIVSENLLRDANSSKDITLTLQNYLASRGVTLKSLSILSVVPSEVEDKLVQEVEALRSQVTQDKAQIETILEKVAAPLQSQGLAKPEEVEKLKTAYAKSPPEGEALLNGLFERFAQWREEQLQSRVAQLAIKDKAVDKRQAPAKKGRGWLAITIYALLALAIGGASAIMYWLRFSKLADIDLSPGHVAAGATILALLSIVILIIIQAIIDRLLHFIISKIKDYLGRPRTGEAKGATPITETVAQEANVSVPVEKPLKEAPSPGRVELRITQESLKIDEMVRRQVARELSLSISNLTESRMQALRQKQNGVAQTIKELIERVEAFRTNVEGDAFLGHIVSKSKGGTRGRADDLLHFEEDLQRQAQVFQSGSEKMLGLLPDNPVEAEAEVKALAASLRKLESHFARREAVMEGVTGPSLKPAAGEA